MNLYNTLYQFVPQKSKENEQINSNTYFFKNLERMRLVMSFTLFTVNKRPKPTIN